MAIDVAHTCQPATNQFVAVACPPSAFTKARRERLCIDLRSLAPALKAHAKARHLTMSEAARIAIASALEMPVPSREEGQEGEASAPANEPIKLTIRLRRDPAQRLRELSRASGLSLGSYLAMLIDGTPAPPLVVAEALGASTDQLAVIAADLNQFVGLHRNQSIPTGEQVDEAMRKVVGDLRRHLDLAARLVAELRPPRTRYRQRPTRAARAPGGR